MSAFDQFIHCLKDRNLLAQTNGEEFQFKSSQNQPLAVYCGFDPTAPSLHMGHLVMVRALVLAQKCGLRPILLLGGGTGRVGDPTGRTEMRPLLSPEELDANARRFEKLLGRYFATAPLFLNNASWLDSLKWLDFARDVGAHFNIAKLLSADVNRTRFQEGGLSFLEMSYQLLQAYDFLHLFQNYNCPIQVGGSDQWSNILAGTDLIRKKTQSPAAAVTVPLLVRSDGLKMGKTSGNAIWLDGEKTPPYDFYQYVINVPDADVLPLALIFEDTEPALIRQRLSAGSIRDHKRDLAFNITSLVHGPEAAQGAQRAAQALFSPQGVGDLEHAPTLNWTHGLPMDIVSFVSHTPLASSKGDVRRLIQGKGLYVNGEVCSDPLFMIDTNCFKDGKLLLRKGKKDYFIIKI